MTEASPPLRVLTWNIHGFVGRDGKRDQERVGRCIGALTPDLAAFQEVDTRHQSPSSPDIYSYLCRQIGDHRHEAWAITGPDGSYGQLLASRYPLSNCKVHDLSLDGREPRKAIEAYVQIPGVSLRVIATHLGLKIFERRHQWQRLNDIISSDMSSPVLLLGDLNEWRHRRLPSNFSRKFGKIRSPGSFPSRFPVLPLDRIYCHPFSWLKNIEAVREASMASDHLPLVAELDWSVECSLPSSRIST